MSGLVGRFNQIRYFFDRLMESERCPPPNQTGEIFPNHANYTAGDNNQLKCKGNVDLPVYSLSLSSFSTVLSCITRYRLRLKIFWSCDILQLTSRHHRKINHELLQLTRGISDQNTIIWQEYFLSKKQIQLVRANVLCITVQYISTFKTKEH